MTKAECLKKTHKLWNFLYKHPKETKQGAYNKLGLEKDRANCPCCAYIKEHKLTCSECPLSNFWGFAGCLDPSSAFHRWDTERPSERASVYAKRIANAAAQRAE